MIEVGDYHPSDREAWNALNASARNGHFMFDRGFMEYHSDRFRDASLVLRDGGRLLAVLPGNISDDVFHSHQGLTFGGLVLGEKLHAAGVLNAFGACLGHLRARGVKRLVYKPLPWIYHQRPAQEDLYALFRFAGQLVRRDVTTTIDYRMPGPRSTLRQRGVKKARSGGLEIGPSDDWPAFWSILSANLAERHGARPTHSLEEILTLGGRFARQIRLFAALKGAEMLAGVVMFETDVVAHAQYIAASPEGRAIGALDGLFDTLIASYAQAKAYFDFGISNEPDDKGLNEGLISQKEGFGGGSVVHDVYQIVL
jgi:hypothetical protein